MIDELPAALKEELLAHVFGADLIRRFNFLQNQAEEGFKWAVVRKFRQMRMDRAQHVYGDGELAEAMYFVNSGNVKLYAENSFPFARFRKGDNFGE